jgi:hypothetical protein
MSIADRLSKATTRAEARAIVDNATKSDLAAAAQRNGYRTGSRDTAASLARTLVDGVGAREDAAAIRSAGWRRK